jgi:hypothetical protein
MERGPVTRSAPPVRQIERVTNRRMPMVRVEKERVNLRPSDPRIPHKSTVVPGGTVKRMVTPERDAGRVKQNAPKVEREVLTPRNSAPRQSAPNEQQRAPEQKKNVQKAKVKRR